MRMRVGLTLAWMVGGLALASSAQDTRTVKEPVIPPACVTLKAELASAGVGLREGDEQKLDTDRIQKALNTCGAGKAVELAAAGPHNAFLTGPLELRDGVTLLVDKGVTLYGSRDPRVYETPNPDAKPGDPIRCGTSMPRPSSFPTFSTGGGRPRGGCRPLIAVNNVKDAAIMGDGVIDGRGYAKLLGKDFSWWEMARKAEPKDDLYFSTRLIVASHADGLVLYHITLHNSPNFHVSVSGTNGFTAWGVHLVTPVDKKLDARNTDGIDPGTSSNVTVAHSWIDNGDDNIAIKQRHHAYERGGQSLLHRPRHVHRL